MFNPKSFDIVVAVDSARGIGKDGGIPWNSPADRREFARITKGGVVIMGRKTWDSLPVRPLPGRFNAVISHSPVHGHVQSFPDLDSAITAYPNHAKFVIGGQDIYEMAIRHPNLHTIHMTMIQGTHECDRFFPDINVRMWNVRRQSSLGEPGVRMVQIEIVNETAESVFLDALRRVFYFGTTVKNRTGVDTRSIRNVRCTYDIRMIPVFTTRKMAYRVIAEELRWFLSGSTTANDLRDRDVHIWDGNTSSAFLKSRGLDDYKEGDTGPGYGFQWRHFGADDWRTPLNGVDQVRELLRGIREDPYSRRHIITAWNPRDVTKAALPPCHVMVQFIVRGDTIHATLTQRSGDMFHGVPFNITSYAILVHWVAALTGYTPGTLHHNITDAHVYATHFDAVEEQILREPKKPPTVRLTGISENYPFFDNPVVEDYNPHPAIKVPMVV